MHPADELYDGWEHDSPRHADQGPYVRCGTCADYMVAPPNGTLCKCHRSFEGLDAIDALDADSKVLPAAPEFPVDAMPQGCRRLIREAAASIGCPPEFVGLPMLVVLGAAIGNSRAIRLKSGWTESATIYGVVIADPGEKKTPAAKVAINPATVVQAELRERYRREVDEYEREVRQHKADERECAKNGMAAPPPPQEPSMESTIVEDATVEALAMILETSPRGVIQMRDELSGWVRAMDQYKAGGKGADRQFYLSSWSNSYVRVDRKGKREPTIISRPFVGAFGSIQPAVLPELGQGRDDGLLDRFLFAYPDHAPSKWTDHEVSDAARAEYASLYRALRGLGLPVDDHGDPDPASIHLSPDARAVMVEAINEHLGEMEQPGFPSRLRGPWSKLEAYLARLTLILGMSRAATDKAAERVESADVLAAVVLLNYLKGMTRRVYVGLYGSDPDDLLAADVAGFLREHGAHFKDEPQVLHRLLRSPHKPPRADELSKRLRVVASRTPGLAFRSGNFWKDGQSRRFVELSLRNGVKSVNGVKDDDGKEG